MFEERTQAAEDIWVQELRKNGKLDKCEISALLEYYAALSGSSVPKFRDTLSVTF
jgi:hypothetical protein